MRILPHSCGLALTALLFVSGCAHQAPASNAAGPAEQKENTAVYIRQLAGLPAGSAEGQVTVLDVGHDPLSTMLSMVANRTAAGWHVSYACASSPRCVPPAEDDRTRSTAWQTEYDLSPEQSARLDAIIAQLKKNREPAPAAKAELCGYLVVTIDDKGFKRDYNRTCEWGAVLGELDELLKPPAA